MNTKKEYILIVIILSLLLILAFTVTAIIKHAHQDQTASDEITIEKPAVDSNDEQGFVEDTENLNTATTSTSNDLIATDQNTTPQADINTTQQTSTIPDNTSPSTAQQYEDTTTKEIGLFTINFLYGYYTSNSTFDGDYDVSDNEYFTDDLLARFDQLEPIAVIHALRNNELQIDTYTTSVISDDLYQVDATMSDGNIYTFFVTLADDRRISDIRYSAP